MRACSNCDGSLLPIKTQTAVKGNPLAAFFVGLGFVDTRTSNVPVCQFQHSRTINASYYSIWQTGCQAGILP